MKTTVIVTLTVCCLLYQTVRAATLNRDGLTREQIRDLLELYNSDVSKQLTAGDKRSPGCNSFTGCLQMKIAQDRVAALLRSQNAHMFGMSGPGKRRRSVDDQQTFDNAETM